MDCTAEEEWDKRLRDEEKEGLYGQERREDVQHLGGNVWTVVSNPPERDGDDGWIDRVRQSDGMLLYI